MFFKDNIYVAAACGIAFAAIQVSENNLSVCSARYLCSQMMILLG